MTTEHSYLLSFRTSSKFLIQICSHPFSVAISNWPSFVGSKSFLSSYDSATSSKVSGVRRVPPGGTEQNFVRGGSALSYNPLTILHTIFDRKGTPFVYFLLTNGTPFTYLFTYTFQIFLLAEASHDEAKMREGEGVIFASS